MNRTETEALIRGYFDAFNRGDAKGMLALLAPDVSHHVNQGEVREGIERFRDFLDHMNETYREEARNLVVMATDDGARAAAECTIRGTYLETDPGLPEANGQTYALPVGSFFEVAGGRIKRVTTYYNLQDWLRQVGA